MADLSSVDVPGAQQVAVFWDKILVKDDQATAGTAS